MALCCICPTSGNIEHLGKYTTLGKKCSVTTWPILLLNSVQIITSVDRRLLNGPPLRDYVPFVLTAIQWPKRNTFAICLNKLASTINQLKLCRECNKENSTRVRS